LANSIFAVASIVILVIVLKLGAVGKLAAPLFTASLFGIIYLIKRKQKFAINFTYLKEALSFCWPLIIAGMLEYFFTGVDRAMLEKLGDNHQMGLYNVAIGVTGYLLIFDRAIGNTFQPDIFKAVAQRKIKKLILIVSGKTILNVIIVLLFILFAPFLIKILTYNRYTDAYGFARILAIRNISRSIFFSISGLIVAFGFPKITLVNKIIGSALSVMIFKYLIENYGFYGGAWGQVISFICLSVVVLPFIIYKMWKKVRLK
jgi:O-antigen/teichoic acid export membrane protein